MRLRKRKLQSEVKFLPKPWVQRRPTLVLDEEFAGIPAAISELQQELGASPIDYMVQARPHLLVKGYGKV